MAKHKKDKNKPVDKVRCPSCNRMVFFLKDIPGGSSICGTCVDAANKLRNMSAAATTNTVEVDTEPTRDL